MFASVGMSEEAVETYVKVSYIILCYIIILLYLYYILY